MRRLVYFLKAMRRVLRAPLNRGRPVATLFRVFRWQLVSRLAPGDLILPFVGDSVLIGRPGMTGMTLNAYCGLAEPAEMGFALHLLRQDDLFVDIGANVGVYTVLASAACGARTIACEPIEMARRDLRRNVSVNAIADRVEIHGCAVGAAAGTLRMSDDRDTMNSVIADGSGNAGVAVPVETLDGLLAGRAPTLIKIDVEGYEEEVLAGGDITLKQETLRAVTLEAGPWESDGGRRRRGLCDVMARYGFGPVQYDPLARRLSPMADADRRDDDIIFVRDVAPLGAILAGAPRRRIMDTDI